MGFENNIGKKIISLAICLLALLPVRAQQLNFFAVDQQTGKPISDVTIWTFNLGKMAQAAKYSLLNEGYFDGDKYDLTDKGVTGTDGFVGLKCSMSGYALVEVISGQYDFTDLIPVATILKGADVKIRIPRASKDRKDSVLKEVPIISIRSIPASGDGITERHGKMKTIYKELEIDPELARSDARFVMAPRVILPQKHDSVALYIAPAVVDGQAYDHTQYRHSYYDVKNDIGQMYQQDGSLRMLDHQGERFAYIRHLYPVERGVKYVVKGEEWYEDYKNVYYQEDVMISDGNDREPMRFLNWDDAKKTIPINRDMYRRAGKSEMTEYPMEFHMEFELGKYELNLNDSLTVAERDRLIDWINLYYQDPNSQVNYVTVRGYASPEGGYNRNVELSHGRANTIVSLLKNRFPSTMKLQNVRAEFDSNNNIVPWSVVADTLDALPDSVAHQYAEKLRGIVSQRSGLDAQQAEVKKDPAMWEYLLANALPRVRRVEIKTNVTTMRVLTRDEIVAKYENDPDFHEGRGEMDYQYYELMCYLADKEDWQGLYTMSKAAYESPTMVQTASRMVAIPLSKATKAEQDAAKKQYADEGKPLPTYILRRQEETRPDPLAAYYYASSLLRKGIVNKQVLKPYLDDGPLNRTRKNGENLVIEYNDVSIIAIQILMYCQDDDFQAANNLIQKYNLKEIPELETLIMFVRCLNGDYRTDPDVRNFVAATSPMNHAVISAAMDDYSTALNLLKEVPQNDMRVQYLEAICRFNQLPEVQRSSRIDAYNSVNIYVTDPKEEEETQVAWASPMLEAFKLEESNVDYIKSDGYFNDAYRQMVLYFWKRLKDGASMDVIAKEYDQLVVEQQEKNKEQK